MLDKFGFANKVLGLVAFNEKAIALNNIISCDCNFIDDMLSEIADMLIEFSDLGMTDAAYEEFWENVNKGCKDSLAWETFYDKYSVYHK